MLFFTYKHFFKLFSLFKSGWPISNIRLYFFESSFTVINPAPKQINKIFNDNNDLYLNNKEKLINLFNKYSSNDNISNKIINNFTNEEIRLIVDNLDDIKAFLIDNKKTYTGEEFEDKLKKYIIDQNKKKIIIIDNKNFVFDNEKLAREESEEQLKVFLKLKRISEKHINFLLNNKYLKKDYKNISYIIFHDKDIFDIKINYTINDIYYFVHLLFEYFLLSFY